jgi:hypothetical protein
MSRMILPRLSTFPRHFVKPAYIQNVNMKSAFKPKKYKLEIGFNYRNTQKQKRNYSSQTPFSGDPRNEPPHWLLAIIGVYIASNFPRDPPKTPFNIKRNNAL